MHRPFRALSPASRAAFVARTAAAAPKLATVDGYSRSEIMREAIRIARTMTFGSWPYKMSRALREVWKGAKAAAAVLASDAEFRACAAARAAARPVRHRPLTFARNAPTVFVSGSRAFSHGW